MESVGFLERATGIDDAQRLSQSRITAISSTEPERTTATGIHAWCAFETALWYQLVDPPSARYTNQMLFETDSLLPSLLCIGSLKFFRQSARESLDITANPGRTSVRPALAECGANLLGLDGTILCSN